MLHLRIRSLFFLVFTALLLGTAHAQPAAPLVVMNLAAHPDDEDGRTLTYYRHARNAVAYSVIFTRGEGGQNEIGPELYEALGAIRTGETERAARHLGTQVFFLNFYDFGYSKHADEAFEKWGGRDHVTARLVYLIRKLKPDVIFTNHDTLTVGPRRQHGQHQAVGISGYDAFTLAADPSYHPEQLDEDGVDLWQPKRLFRRLWRGPADGAYDVALPVGAVDPETGAPYYERAVAAIMEHASQGMGQFASRLRGDTTYFRLIRSAADAPLDAADLAANLPPNHAAHPDLSYRIDAGRVPALPAGALTLDHDVAVPGQSVTLRWRPEDLPAPRLRWVFSGAVDTTLVLTGDAPALARLRIAPEAVPTTPKKVYQYRRFLNHPPVVYALYRAGTDTLLAAGYLPLEVAPPVFVEAVDDVVRLRSGANTIPLRVRVFDPVTERLTLDAAVTRDADAAVIREVRTTLTPGAGGRADADLTLDLPAGLAPGDYTITLAARPDAAVRTPEPARARLHGRVFEAAVAPGLRVGVVRSYDDTLEKALAELGVSYVMLDSLALARGDFDDLHTIVVDIRAYLVRPDLRAHNARLLEWVRRGGHLIVNYQKTFEWNPEYADPFDRSRKNPGDFSPYPIHLSRDRVTREDAPVTVLHPELPLFHAPNEITGATWDGWAQERGLYFPREYDAAYVELFEMNDPGEPPLRGSTLLARYGEGTYLYTALVWYRQLKRFHPGVYAMFANLVSLPLVDGRAAPGSSGR
jgi:LmbE family N-acetylglucosaminyl deacetylase